MAGHIAALLKPEFYVTLELYEGQVFMVRFFCARCEEELDNAGARAPSVEHATKLIFRLAERCPHEVLTFLLDWPLFTKEAARCAASIATHEYAKHVVPSQAALN